MPELPDIELYLSALRERVQGQVLERIRVSSPFVVRSYDPPIAALHGHKVIGLRRIGKRIVFALEEELFFVVHLMIAGRFKERPRGAAVPRRVGLLAMDFPKLTLVLTEVSKKKRASANAVRGEAALAEHDPGGIDVLNCTLKQFHEALVFENHTLKRTMTDPRVFSGIGNGYSDEILHHAQLSPVKWTTRLSDDEVARLYASTRWVLVHWTKLLNDERAGGWPEKVTAFRPEMVVHGKFKQACPRCQAPIQRIVRGASEINYCAPCQTGGKLLADRALSRLLKGDWPKTIAARDERMKRLREDGEGAEAPTKPTLPASLQRPKARRSGKAAAKKGAEGSSKPALPASLQRPNARRPAKAAAKKAKAERNMGERAGAVDNPSAAAHKPTKTKTKTKRRSTAKPLMLFAHGAGASSMSPWMQAWRERLGRIAKVVSFDYAYMAEGRKLPDRHDKLLAAHAEALKAARKRHRGKVILVGKSMGSRIGCHLSLEQPVDGLVCFGYPLVSQGKLRKVRDEVLKALTTPLMFIQGTRDRLCPLEQLEAVRAQLQTRSELHVVETGDHSLLVTKTWSKKSGRSQNEVDEQVFEALAAFVESL